MFVKLKSSDYDNLPLNCKIIPKITITDTTVFAIKLNIDIKNMIMCEFSDISSYMLKGMRFDKLVIDYNRSWVDIPASYLDLSSGKHTYCLSFIAKDLDIFDMVETYFTYIIQDSNVFRPYIYMKDHYSGSNSDDMTDKYLED